MTGTPKSIVILIPWFGTWPAWMRFFLLSCRANPTVDWVLISDCGDRRDIPPNVRLIQSTFPDYRDLVSSRLRVTCLWDGPYKLCDLKPALGLIHAEEVKGYDYWGFGDLDVVYGDIRQIYTPEILRHDLVSSHSGYVSGHFLLVRNSDIMNLAFKRVRGWKKWLSANQHYSFDEKHWSSLFMTRANQPFWRTLKFRLISPPMTVSKYFVEQYSTDLSPETWVDGSQGYPKTWTWTAGKLTTDKVGAREFLYLHFTQWQSGRWIASGIPPWNGLARLDQCPDGPLEQFTVSANGFLPVD